MVMGADKHSNAFKRMRAIRKRTVAGRFLTAWEQITGPWLLIHARLHGEFPIFSKRYNNGVS
jgi:hypothetical protein